MRRLHDGKRPFNTPWSMNIKEALQTQKESAIERCASDSLSRPSRIYSHFLLRQFAILPFSWLLLAFNVNRPNLITNGTTAAHHGCHDLSNRINFWIKLASLVGLCSRRPFLNIRLRFSWSAKTIPLSAMPSTGLLVFPWCIHLRIFRIGIYSNSADSILYPKNNTFISYNARLNRFFTAVLTADHSKECFTRDFQSKSHCICIYGTNVSVVLCSLVLAAPDFGIQ